MIFKGRLFVFVAANFRSKSEKAEQEHLEHVFVCQNGGGEKGVARHVQINKKVLVRDRLRRILDEDSDFFELSTTAGIPSIFVCGHRPKSKELLELLMFFLFLLFTIWFISF